ncbi:TPA: hypothetical protein ACH3X2_000709 [Trebouxia sp. C0005]
MVQTRAQFKLDVRAQKDQGIYKNTNNSLTGASASSAGAIHYATALETNNPMPMARPRAHGSMKVGRKSKYAPGVFKAHLRSVALGRTKRGGGRRKSHKKHHVRHHKHKYKAVIYLNGEKVKEMFDFSLYELKERLTKHIEQLDATSHTPLTKAVLRTWEPCAWDSAAEAVQIQETQAKDPVSACSEQNFGRKSLHQ